MCFVKQSVRISSRHKCDLSKIRFLVATIVPVVWPSVYYSHFFSSQHLLKLCSQEKSKELKCNKM